MEAPDNETVKVEKGEEAPDIEKAITSAMRARIGHFKEQADSLTLEGVRRLLEKDMGLATLALDTHKRFIKQCLDKCFAAAAAEEEEEEEDISKSSGETVEEIVQSTEDETKKLSEGRQPQKVIKGPSSEDKKMEGSPVLGLLAGDETQNEVDESRVKSEKVPSKDTIKKAIKNRSSYFRSNSGTLTMVGARRLLEKDLNLEKNALDPHKKFITEKLDEVLTTPEVDESANGVKNKIIKKVKKDTHSKARRKVSREGSSDSSDSEDGGVHEVDEKPKKKTTTKGRTSSEEPKKRKRSVKEEKASSNKRSKPVESTLEGSSDAEDGGNLSEDGRSQSSADEEPVKKREVSAHVYGKRVEHLKAVIKSCGMSVPPSVYKKVKQKPENKREAYLIEELKEILGKEGLSTNPSEKEIKEVRKKKERSKELEGIDMSNIVSSSRRRSTYSFTPPPKLKIPDEGDEDDEEEESEDEDDDDNSDSNSESEEHNEDEDESD